MAVAEIRGLEQMVKAPETGRTAGISKGLVASGVAFGAAATADVGITLMAFSISGNVVESNPAALKAMAELGDFPGLFACFAGESAGIFLLAKILPERLKKIPLLAAGYFHANGFLSHYMAITHKTLPDPLEGMVNYSLDISNGFFGTALAVTELLYDSVSYAAGRIL